MHAASAEDLQANFSRAVSMQLGFVVSSAQRPASFQSRLANNPVAMIKGIAIAFSRFATLGVFFFLLPLLSLALLALFVRYRSGSPVLGLASGSRLTGGSTAGWSGAVVCRTLWYPVPMSLVLKT